MQKRKCRNPNCRCIFEVHLRNPNQKYCTKEKCQKVRKAARQRWKLANDEEYRRGQEDSKKKWKAENPDYWKKYRKKKSKYTKRNREKQRDRDRSKKALKVHRSISPDLAKMHPLMDQNHIISGRYELIPVQKRNLAKMHPLIVEINEITDDYEKNTSSCKDAPDLF